MPTIPSARRVAGHLIPVCRSNRCDNRAGRPPSENARCTPAGLGDSRSLELSHHASLGAAAVGRRSACGATSPPPRAVSVARTRVVSWLRAAILAFPAPTGTSGILEFACRPIQWRGRAGITPASGSRARGRSVVIPDGTRESRRDVGSRQAPRGREAGVGRPTPRRRAWRRRRSSRPPRCRVVGGSQRRRALPRGASSGRGHPAR